MKVPDREPGPIEGLCELGAELGGDTHEFFACGRRQRPGGCENDLVEGHALVL
jgi:hypothetical protein